MACRKLLYDAEFPETRRGAFNQHTATSRHNGEKQPERFSTRAAEFSGKSERLRRQPTINGSAIGGSERHGASGVVMGWLRASTCAAFIATLGVFGASSAQSQSPLPEGFVYLRTVAPGILQDMRYAGAHNFVGRPIEGYHAAECILTLPAAEALARAEAELRVQGLTIQVFDCYRPAQAVGDFVQWARALDDVAMKAEFYPRVDKSELFDRGYIAFEPV